MNLDDVKRFQFVTFDFEAWLVQHPDTLDKRPAVLPSQDAIWRVVHVEFGWVHIQHVTPAQDLWAMSTEPEFLTLVHEPNPDADYRWVAKVVEQFGRELKG